MYTIIYYTSISNHIFIYTIIVGEIFDTVIMINTIEHVQNAIAVTL